MNREQRRSKRYKKAANTVKQMVETFGKEDNKLQAGDKVRIDVTKMTGRKDWSRLQDGYKDFILSHKDDVFTVRLYRDEGEFPAIVELEEALPWLFWYGDLIVVEKNHHGGG